MCLIIFAHQVEHRFPLVLAANRDEFFTRPTQQAEFWEAKNSESTILAGRDLLAGGIWLGLSVSGRFSAVTNIREPSRVEQTPISRGELPLKFLQSSLSAKEYAQSLTNRFRLYSGFNLLVSDGNDMYYVNNQENLVSKLKPGIYGLSNGLLDSDWPKVNRGKKDLRLIMKDINELNTDDLLEMMSHREVAVDAKLPKTGIPLYPERALSPAFITDTDRGYGTLSSTAIIVSQNGEIRFSEKNYDSVGVVTACHYYQFSIPNK